MRRLVVLAALTAFVVAGCGGSSAPKGPPGLVFVSTRDGDYALFGSDAQGKHARRLSKEKGDPSTPAGLFFQVDPAWSPDGRTLAFASRREGVEHIYAMRWDGTGTRRLTSGKEDDSHPSWSPDGMWIVFARGGALFRIPAAGGPVTRVPTGKGNAGDPAYSPDGRLIAFDYRVPGSADRDIYVTRADGTGVRRLTDLRATSALPAWSPDGKTLAFESDIYGGHVEIYTVPVAGGDVTRIMSTESNSIQPAWSPDGTRLAFSRDGAIWTTANGKETELTSEDDNDSAPAWRPVQPK